jgi:catechol 2,3-dioxygenase-like lactoylglutathione lyase family enzyme
MAAKGRLVAVQPVLPSRDVALAVAWYVHKLGFHMQYTDQPTAPRYAVLLRDGVELHLQWADEAQFPPGLDRPMLRFPVDDILALYAEYSRKGVFHENTALKRTAWKTEEFAFYDRDGNGLTFYRALGPDE